MRLALALLFVSAPAVAAAQSAVVIVPEVEASGDALERARAGAIEALAERGVRLVRAPDGEPCEEADCAAEIAGRAGADFVVLVLLEAREDGGQRVRARLVRASGEPRDAVIDVGDAGVAEAAAAALTAALEAQATHGSGFLMVRTTPPGAVVEIDGERAGESPLRRMVSAGEHRVRVVPASGQAREREVTVRALEETAVEIDLEAREEAEEEAAASRPARTEPSPLNWIIGGALAIAGVVTLISPLQTLATEGECVELIENVGCVERVQFGAQSGILLGLGLAALTAAVVVDAVAPIRVTVEAGATGAFVGVEGRF
ncbi:MAG: PEGA domain-containing protein [Sandaracinaceae bacterium]|nr:PEGA domain-containing protein [Sandaracinaceae bacterium]